MGYRLKLRWFVKEREPHGYTPATDEALMHVKRDEAVLRFVTWYPPGISIGATTDWSLVKVDRLKERGYSLVRRCSGGGGIFTSETGISLAFVIPIWSYKPFKPKEAYCRVSKTFSGMLAELGILSLPASGTRHVTHAQLNCFNEVERCEIVYAERKILGGAVAWDREANFLYHIHIPLDRTGFDALNEYCDNPVQEAVHPVSLNEAAGREIGREEVYRALVTVLSREFDPYEGDYTPEERSFAEAYYHDHAWEYWRL